MKNSWIVFFILFLIASFLSSCKYGRPIMSTEIEKIHTTINDTTIVETVRNFHTFRRFKIVEAYQDEIKMYDSLEKLIEYKRIRCSPKEIKDGNNRTKSKTITYNQEGEKSGKEIKFTQHLGKKKQKNIVFFDGRRRMVMINKRR